MPYVSYPTLKTACACDHVETKQAPPTSIRSGCLCALIFWHVKTLASGPPSMFSMCVAALPSRPLRRWHKGSPGIGKALNVSFLLGPDEGT